MGEAQPTEAGADDQHLGHRDKLLTGFTAGELTQLTDMLRRMLSNLAAGR